MSAIKQQFLDVDGFKIAYTECGPRDGRILFCAHGLLSNGRDYDFLSEDLAAKGYRVIAIDLPGRGKSDFFADPMYYTPVYYLPYCQAVLQHIGASGGNYDWLGVSLGGMLGMMMCVDQVLSPARFIIVDVGPYISAYAMDKVTRLARKSNMFEDLPQAVEFLKWRCGGWGIKGEEIWNHLIKHNIRKSADGKCVMHYDSQIGVPMKDENDDADAWPLWDLVTQDVLIVRGGKSFILVPEISARMIDHFKGGDISEIVFEDCGHVPNLMQEDHISALSDWLGAP